MAKPAQDQIRVLPQRQRRLRESLRHLQEGRKRRERRLLPNLLGPGEGVPRQMLSDRQQLMVRRSCWLRTRKGRT